MAVLTTVIIAVPGAASTGCSLTYTKGPEPQMRPPPICTTSNDAPIADTVLAAASVGAVVAGSIIAHNTKCGEPWCGLSNGLTGDALLVLGGIGTIAFVPSAIVGYNRTASCRAWLEKNPQYTPHLPPAPASRQPKVSSSALAPAPTCPSRGDAPFLCSLRGSFEAKDDALIGQW